MPKLDWNKETWDHSYNWEHQGDEWSRDWGGPSMQWFGTLLPRIHRFVPTGTILEIAPGYGRWTQFLKDLCQTLVGVDLSESCVDACRRRFARASHAVFHVNDGRSLDVVRDGSVDFAFSFDSLVHADDDVIEGYVAQLARKLSSDGVAFIHHSNLGVYPSLRRLDALPPIYRRPLVKLKLIEPTLHHRSPTMTAEKMERFAEQHGLRCISQELVPWGTRPRVLLDCMSTLVPRSSPRCRENRVFRNHSFGKEAAYLSRLSRLYTGSEGVAATVKRRATDGHGDVIRGRTY
jgi:hypothetical protein